MKETKNALFHACSGTGLYYRNFLKTGKDAICGAIGRYPGFEKLFR